VRNRISTAIKLTLEKNLLLRPLVRLLIAKKKNKRWGIKNSLTAETAASRNPACMAIKTVSTKKPGAFSRPGATREFQFHE
jgi:hypothetical protein